MGGGLKWCLLDNLSSAYIVAALCDERDPLMHDRAATYQWISFITQVDDARVYVMAVLSIAILAYTTCIHTVLTEPPRLPDMRLADALVSKQDGQWLKRRIFRFRYENPHRGARFAAHVPGCFKSI